MSRLWTALCQAELIVLCHGWPENAYTWRYQISELANEQFAWKWDRAHIGCLT